MIVYYIDPSDRLPNKTSESEKKEDTEFLANSIAYKTFSEMERKQIQEATEAVLKLSSDSQNTLNKEMILPAEIAELAEKVLQSKLFHPEYHELKPEQKVAGKTLITEICEMILPPELAEKVFEKKKQKEDNEETCQKTCLFSKEYLLLKPEQKAAVQALVTKICEKPIQKLIKVIELE